MSSTVFPFRGIGITLRGGEDRLETGETLESIFDRNVRPSLTNQGASVGDEIVGDVQPIWRQPTIRKMTNRVGNRTQLDFSSQNPILSSPCLAFSKDLGSSGIIL